MTPKEKANELANKFFFKNVFKLSNEELHKERNQAKKSALISVDEIILICPYLSQNAIETVEQSRAHKSQFVSYWQQVKQEIEKL